ncbi:MAG: hypothetical protein QHJ73_07155 [Armatimonadota bacterium]|nr:hypothetical protein [Armatimonadota bacterium]
MTPERTLTAEVKRCALAAGADLVGVASIDRFDRAPAEVHPRSIFSKTESVVAVACRMLRGALKTIEEGNYWQAYNCDSYQYLNEILAPQLLRAIALLLEEHGYTAVPIHNPFGPYQGRPVRVGGTRPDGHVSLRVLGCAAGLGELGLSKLLLTPQFGPRQRVYAILTDAVLEADPLLSEPVCDECGSCARACPAGAIGRHRAVEVPIGERVFRHAPLDCARCSHVHQGWDPAYSPFLREGSSPENPPPYFRFLDHRFRHRSICGGRGCIRACVDHLEKSGRLQKSFRLPMIEGRQWVIED